MSVATYQHRSAAEWQALIDEQAFSGMTQLAFCEAKGLAKSSFYHWKQRLRDTRPVPKRPHKPEALFVPLSVAGAVGEQAASSHWDVEIDLGNGICLRLRRPA